MKEKLFFRRDFLNKDWFHEDATIMSNIAIDDKWIDCVVKLRDCDSRCHFYFDYENEEGYENAMYKIDTMIGHLLEFREALIKNKSKLIKNKEAE